MQKHICWRLFAVLPDTKRLFRQHATKRRMQKHICAALLFCSKFALRNCDWRKFRLRVQVFDTKKTICTRFSGHCKNSFAPSFRISFYLKIYFWIDVCNAFSGNRTASGMSILPLPPTYAYSVSIKFTHSVHYSGICLFNNGGIGKKLTMACSLFTFLAWPTQIFAVFRAIFFQNAFFENRSPYLSLCKCWISTKMPAQKCLLLKGQQTAHYLQFVCKITTCAKTQKIPEKIGDFCLIQE